MDSNLSPSKESEPHKSKSSRSDTRDRSRDRDRRSRRPRSRSRSRSRDGRESRSRGDRSYRSDHYRDHHHSRRSSGGGRGHRDRSRDHKGESRSYRGSSSSSYSSESAKLHVNRRHLEEFMDRMTYHERELFNESENTRARTVIVKHLPSNTTQNNLTIFFHDNGCGIVRDAQIIYDKYSNKPKGIAFVEFCKLESIPKALALSNRLLLGTPIVVQLMEQDSRLLVHNNAELGSIHPAAQTGQAMCKLYVGNIDAKVSEEAIRALLSPFGEIERCRLHVRGIKSFAIVEYKTVDAAKTCVETMHGFLFSGLPLKVTFTNESSPEIQSEYQLPPGNDQFYMSSNDTTTFSNAATGGETELFNSKGFVNASVMAELLKTYQTDPTVIELVGASEEDAQFKPPELSNPLGYYQQSASSQPVIPVQHTKSNCILIKNLYQLSEVTNDNQTIALDSIPQWKSLLIDSISDVVNNYGKLTHVQILDNDLQGTVYLQFESIEAAENVLSHIQLQRFNGRYILAEPIPSQVYEQAFL